MNVTQKKDTDQLLRWAFGLSMITIFYNLLEGAVSTYYGLTDDTLALFGFGVDSFVEVLSGIGIAHMVYRMRQTGATGSGSLERDRFERQALRLTGVSFYLLAVGIVISSALTIYVGEQPQTTVVGIIVATLSIATMFFLARYKLRVGQALQSDPIISDAHCTQTCLYLSLLLLVSSGLYELFRIPYVDAVGALGIAWFAVKEGREAFEKAKGKSCEC